MQTLELEFDIVPAKEMREKSSKASGFLTKKTIRRILTEMNNTADSGGTQLITSVIPSSSDLMDQFFEVLRKNGYQVVLIGHRVTIEWHGPTNKQNGPL